VVRITLRYFDGCPNWRLAEGRIEEALAAAGHDAAIARERVDTPEQGERLGFRGSPTVLLDGRDPFADQAGPVGFSCRLYKTENGPQGAPSVRQLVEALAR